MRKAHLELLKRRVAVKQSLCGFGAGRAGKTGLRMFKCKMLGHLRVRWR